MAMNKWEDELGKQVLESANAAVDESKAMGNSVLQRFVPLILIAVVAGGFFWFFQGSSTLEASDHEPSVEETSEAYSSNIAKAGTLAEQMANYLAVESSDSTTANTTPLPSFLFQDLTFAVGSADLMEATELESLAQLLRDHPEVHIEVGGHTDNTGAADANLKLSAERAAAVKMRLMELEVPAAQITARGYGLTQPLGDNGTEEGRAQNRRTELRITQQ